MVAWNEQLHPRGQPGNRGQFTESFRQDEPSVVQQVAQAALAAATAQKRPSDGIDGLTDEENKALANYFQNARAINLRMRMGRDDPNFTLSGKTISGLDDLMSRGRLSSDTVVYRVIGSSDFRHQLDALKSGDVMTDNGYISTSLFPYNDRLAMRIYAKAGSRALVAGDHAVDDKHDNEIIFARGSHLVYRGKDKDGTFEFDLDQDLKAEVTGLDEAVIDVGGDVWNRETAVRLEREYKKSLPQLEELVDKLAGSEDLVKETISEWDGLAGNVQKNVEDDWKQSSYTSELNSAVESWQENDAYKDAAEAVVYKFQQAADLEWITDAVNAHMFGTPNDDQNVGDLNEFIGGRAAEGKPAIPFDVADIVRATILTTNDEGKLDVEFDNAMLQAPIGFTNLQMTLPGIEPLKPEEMLTEAMRKDLTEVIEEAFKEKAEDIQTSLDPPDYLQDSAKETVDMYWDELSEDEKFAYAKKAGYVEKEEVAVEVMDPDDFEVDPLEENDDATAYRATQALAKQLSIQRTAELMKQRGEKTLGLEKILNKYADNESGLISTIEVMDHDLWDNWKSASHSPQGKIIQAAIAEELGGRLRQSGVHAVDIDTAKENANTEFEGGWEAVKAYVRAKWETTQYLLDKANKPMVDVFRAVHIDDVAKLGQQKFQAIELTPEAAAVQDASFKVKGGQGEQFYFKTKAEADAFAEKKNVEFGIGLKPVDTSIRTEDINGYTKLPDLTIHRNGAASMTTDSGVANGWGQNLTRVVMRARVPRTAVVSVPAYGQNIHSEHEVVVAGTAWNKWDAFYQRAPKFEEVAA